MDLSKISPEGIFTAVDETPEVTIRRLTRERNAALVQLEAFKAHHDAEVSDLKGQWNNEKGAKEALQREVKNLKASIRRLKKRVNNSVADKVEELEVRLRKKANDLIAFNQDIRRAERKHAKEKDALEKRVEFLNDGNQSLRRQVSDLQRQLMKVRRAQVNNQLYSHIRSLRARLNDVLSTSGNPIDQPILPGRVQQMQDDINGVTPNEVAEPDPTEGGLEID